MIATIEHRTDRDLPYWSAAEAMPPEQLREVQERRFRRQLQHCWDHSRWYRRHWERHGFDPSGVRGLDDIDKLPFVTKDDLRSSQEAAPPFGALLTDDTPVSRISRMAMTSGTTGRPVLVPFTAEDYELWMEGVARALWACGVGEDDVVHAAFGFTPFVGLAGAYDACERWLGCLVIPGGSWDTATRISMIPRLGITVLMGTPTYLLHLGRAAQERGQSPADWPVRMIWVTGEPGPMSAESTGERLRALWQTEIREFCGSQETNYWAWTCSHGSVHWNEDLVYVEVLDPETGEAVDPGQPGDLVLTDLCQRTHPLLRFPSGDRVAGVERRICPCGRTLAIFKGFLGRIDDVVKIRGVSVSPVAIENIVRAHARTSDNYEIEFSTGDNGMDRVQVRVEPGDGQVSETLGDDLAEQLRTNLLLRIGVTVVPPGTLPVYELKAKRVVDRRQPAGSRP